MRVARDSSLLCNIQHERPIGVRSPYPIRINSLTLCCVWCVYRHRNDTTSILDTHYITHGIIRQMAGIPYKCSLLPVVDLVRQASMPRG
jgi:hypothetical protein